LEGSKKIRAHRILFGIGNPGRRYERTRHNIGFRILERLARKWPFGRWKRKGASMRAVGEIKGHSVLLVKPLTYVNLCGSALRQVLEETELPLAHLLVVSDDFSLPLGKLRFRRRGSSGGHRGLQSIIDALGSRDFQRLRIGIGGPGEEDAADFVLSEFGPEEEEIIEETLDRASLAAAEWVESGIEQCMRRYNQ